MFKKQDTQTEFKKLWGYDAKLGEQITFARILIEVKRIEGDTLFWEEVPWSELKE